MLRDRFPRHGAVTAVLLGTLAVGACTQFTSPYLDRDDKIAFSAGNAVETNEVAQVYDPWPVHAKYKNIATSGSRMAIAVRKYHCAQSGLPVRDGGGGGGITINNNNGPQPSAPSGPAPEC